MGSRGIVESLILKDFIPLLACAHLIRFRRVTHSESAQEFSILPIRDVVIWFAETVDHSLDCVPVSIVSVWKYSFLFLWKRGKCMMPKSYTPLLKTKLRFKILHDWL